MLSRCCCVAKQTASLSSTEPHCYDYPRGLWVEKGLYRRCKDNPFILINSSCGQAVPPTSSLPVSRGRALARNPPSLPPSPHPSIHPSIIHPSLPPILSLPKPATAPNSHLFPLAKSAVASLSKVDTQMPPVFPNIHPSMHPSTNPAHPPHASTGTQFSFEELGGKDLDKTESVFVSSSPSHSEEVSLCCDLACVFVPLIQVVIDDLMT